MSGVRVLWRANGMKEENFGKPVIAIVNSFIQFVPGHMHLHNAFILQFFLNKRRYLLNAVIRKHTPLHHQQITGADSTRYGDEDGKKARTNGRRPV